MIEIRVTELSVPPRVPGQLRLRDVHVAVLRVVHQGDPLRDAVRDDRAAGDHAVAVEDLDPVVVARPRSPRRPRPTATSTGPPRKSVSIVRLSWNSEWIDHFECGESQRTCDLGPVRVAGELLADVADHVDRRPVGGQPLAELEQPVVVDVELLAPGERAPRHAALDVDRERRVAALARLRSPTTPARRSPSAAAPACRRRRCARRGARRRGRRAGRRCAARASGSPRRRGGRS